MTAALRLKGRDWGFIAVAAAVVGTLIVLSMVGKKAGPMLAADYHAGVTAASGRAECMTCHDPDRPGVMAPLPGDHPLSWKKETVSCTVCHQPPSGDAARSARLALRQFHRAPHRAPLDGRNAQ